MAKMTVDDIKVSGKKVLVRCDFNVPMKDGKITNDKRIVAALPTIKKLIADGGKVILCSHLGKPKNGPEAKFSLAPVAARLSEYLGKPVVFADDDTVVGENAKAAVAAMKDGDVVVYSLDQAFFGHCDRKLAGTLVPVFSLRSARSAGIGDFGDLKTMIDYVEKTGQKVLQLLPVNDTTITHTWTDSYPYSCISILSLIHI